MTTAKRRPCAIPDALTAATLAQLRATNPATGRTYTLREVSRWLLEAHGVTASREAVRRLYRHSVEHDEQLVVAALREELREQVAPAIHQVRRAARRIAEMLPTERNLQKVAAGARALTAALDTFAKLSGVAKPLAVDVTTDGQPLSDARQRLAENLARLPGLAVPGGAGGAAGDPPG